MINKHYQPLSQSASRSFTNLQKWHCRSIFNIEPHKHDIPVFDSMCAFLLESQVKFPKWRCHFNLNSEFTIPVGQHKQTQTEPKTRNAQGLKIRQTLKPRFNIIKTKLTWTMCITVSQTESNDLIQTPNLPLQWRTTVVQNILTCFIPVECLALPWQTTLVQC